MSSPTELLTEIEGNPIPPGAIAGIMTARDGHPIRYARFSAQSRPLKGTVVMLHGRNECIEKYFETVRDLASQGFASTTFDWRGQGGSGRLLKDPQRGYVDDFNAYVADLEQFFEEIVLPDCRGPFYILSHSTGGLIALLAAPYMSNRVQRMVLVAPLLSLNRAPFSLRVVTAAARLGTMFGLGSRYMAGGPRPREALPFASNILTTDHARYRRNQMLFEANPGLALGGPTFAWVDAASRAIATVTEPDYLASIRIPSLFIAAGADEVVSTEAVEDYARRLRSGSLLTIDGARHEILQEADIYREQLLAAFFAFVPGEDSTLA